MTVPQPAHPKTARMVIEFLLMLVQSNEKKISYPALRIGVRIDRKLTTKCWVGSSDWLDLSDTSKLCNLSK